MTPALALERITCTFAAREDRSRRYTAVKDTTLVVAAGEFVSVVGPTGCGKSTLLNVAAGLLEPSAGSVTVNGEPVEAEVWEGESLLYALREHMGLPGSKNACEQGECGSCSVYLDGEVV